MLTAYFGYYFLFDCGVSKLVSSYKRPGSFLHFLSSLSRLSYWVAIATTLTYLIGLETGFPG